MARVVLEDHLRPAGRGQDLPRDAPRPADRGRRDPGAGQGLLPETGPGGCGRHHLHHQRIQRVRDLQLLRPGRPGHGAPHRGAHGPALRRVPAGRLLLHQQQEGRRDRGQGEPELDRVPPGPAERGRAEPGRGPGEGRQPQGQGNHQIPQLVRPFPGPGLQPGGRSADLRRRVDGHGNT